MKARPYQIEAINSVISEFEKSPSTLMMMPVGTGKTVCFAHIANHFRKNGRCLILAHREELIFQAAQKIEAVTGIRPDIEMGDMYAREFFHTKCEIVVSTVQTQNAGRVARMERFAAKDFSLVIVDECHRAAADSYRRVLRYFSSNPDLRILGVTATADRADKKALGQIFKTCAYQYDIDQAIYDGWLTPIHQKFSVHSGLDYSGVKTTAGDLNGKDLAIVLEDERNLHPMIIPVVETIGNKKSLFFAVSVEQAKRTAEIFNRYRTGMAKCVFGETDREDRRRIFDQHRQGLFQVLVNVGVCGEGYDDPGIEAVIMGRPTKSRLLYTQAIGRGTRPLPGVVDAHDTAEARRAAIAASAKPYALVYDFVGNSGRHKLISTADVLGGRVCDEIVERAKRIVTESGRDMDMSKAIERAQAQKREEEERQRRADAAAREHVRARLNYKFQDVDPFRWGRSLPANAETQKIPYWMRFHRATDGQIKKLREFGIDATSMTKLDAWKAIQAIADNGWRRPAVAK